MSNFTKIQNDELKALQQFRRLNRLRIRTELRYAHAQACKDLGETLIQAVEDSPEDDSALLSNLFSSLSESTATLGTTPGALRYLNSHLRIHLDRSRLWKEFP